MSVQSAASAVLPKQWEPPAQPSPRPAWLTVGAPLLAVTAALVGWFAPLAGVDLRDMSDIGLLSILPAPSLAAFGLLCVSFCLELRRSRPRVGILLVHVLALLVMVYGLPAVIEPEPRFAVTWRHVGIIGKIVHTGTIDPRIDAYFNWPGFFAGAALVQRAAGLDDLIGGLSWAPLVFELLALAPLLLILRSLTSGTRLRWMAVWCFYLANWVGQDYFSPQAFTYVLYLVVLGAILTWLRGPAPWRPPWATRKGLRLRVGVRERAVEVHEQSPSVRDGLRLRVGARERAVELHDQAVSNGAANVRKGAKPSRLPFRGRRLRTVLDAGWVDHAPSPAANVAIVGCVILMVAAIVSSHQLTPFALLPGITALVLLRRCSARGLPLVIVLIIGAWMSYMAIAYLAGHEGKLLGNVGALGSIVNQSVAGRVQGASGHQLVTTAQLVLAGGLWSLAALGAWRRARAGYDDVSAIVLGGSSFVLPLLQPYGGEILLRIFLFSLPFTAFFVAALFITPSTSGRSPAITIALVILSFGLAGTQLLVRYGNERMDWFSSQEVAAVQALYRDAPPKSTLVAWSTSLPWKYRDYAEHQYRVITDEPGWSRPAGLPAGSPAQLAALSRLMRGQPHGAYLILTRSQAAQVDLVGLGKPGTLRRVWRALETSPAFHVVYSNPDGLVVTTAPRRSAK